MLDVVVSENWYYPDVGMGMEFDAISKSGNFTSVWMSIRNTGQKAALLQPSGVLLTDTGERFKDGDDASHPGLEYGTELAPREVIVAPLIFDTRRMSAQ